MRRSGALSQTGRAQAQPQGGAFRAGAGRQTACLQVPAGADFDLFLQRFSLRNGFQTVARSTGTGDQRISFDGRAGTYRYVVASAAGSVDYTLAFATP